MNSQKYNKKEIYPDDFTDDDKLDFDIYLEQGKQLFPKLANEEWLIKMAIIAYIRQSKTGEFKKLTDEEIAEMKARETKETVFYTEPIAVIE